MRPADSHSAHLIAYMNLIGSCWTLSNKYNSHVIISMPHQSLFCIKSEIKRAFFPAMKRKSKYEYESDVQIRWSKYCFFIYSEDICVLCGFANNAKTNQTIYSLDLKCSFFGMNNIYFAVDSTDELYGTWIVWYIPS